MKRAVITGATGAIGTALIERLLAEQVEILVLVREGSKRNEKIPISPLVKMAYCSLEQLRDFENPTDAPYDAFFHLAWAGPFGADRNNMFMQSDNIRHELDAVELAARLGCTVFVGAGSQAEYGRVPAGKKLSADLACRPENGYGIAKLTAGQMSRILCEQRGLRHVWGRILSTYGPGDGEHTLVMSSVVKFLNGEDGDFTKGEQQWDYLYNGDVANAFYLMAEHGVHGKVYPIGSGKTRPLAEFITLIRDAANPACRLNFGAVPYFENQVMYLCADIDELTADTGFVPSVSFEEGIARTVAWYKENKK